MRKTCKLVENNLIKLHKKTHLQFNLPKKKTQKKKSAYYFCYNPVLLLLKKLNE